MVEEDGGPRDELVPWVREMVALKQPSGSTLCGKMVVL